MSSEYYSLEQAAEVLGIPTAEVNRLREKSQLRAFRDGSSWKFRKVDVDNQLAEIIKNRSKSGQAAGESDFDLLSLDDDAEETPTLLADQASFDSLASELPDEDGMISTAKDDTFSLEDDDLVMADDDLTLSEDSDLALKPNKASSSDVDLAVDDDLILEGGSSAQLDLAGDSGLSLLDMADDDLQPTTAGGSDDMIEFDDILSLADDDDLVVDNTSTIAIPVEDDFQLIPDAGGAMVDDSESASQVIALEEDNVFGGMDGSSGFGSAETPFVPVPNAAEPMPGSGFGSPAGGFGAGAPGEFVSSGPAFNPTPTSMEPSYGPVSVVILFFLASVLALSGVMVLDLIIHIWSWGEPFVISSTLMDMLAGMAGLK